MYNSGFAHLAELVRRRAGITLPAEKAHATVRRLASVGRMFGFANSEDLLAELAHPREELAEAVTEAVTIQDTSFFRDPEVFAYLENVILPPLLEARAGKKRLRIWSAGCATGQEPYSLATLLEDAGLMGRGWIVDLIATDICSDAIARAKDGIYSNHEIQRGLPAAVRARYFGQDCDGWRATERLRRAVMFRRFNLLDHFGWLGEIDVILCRNVLIYFAPEERTAVIEKLSRTLSPDGRLVLGESESSAANMLPFRPVAGCRGVFVK
jgi:chemotaxis protein methyltransferase CheR